MHRGVCCRIRYEGLQTLVSVDSLVEDSMIGVEDVQNGVGVKPLTRSVDTNLEKG